MTLKQLPYEELNQIVTRWVCDNVGYIENYEQHLANLIHIHGWTVEEYLNTHMPTYRHKNKHRPYVDTSDIPEERYNELTAYDKLKIRP